MTSRTGWSLVFALLLASWPIPAAAQAPQNISIVPVQNLSFGLLLPGFRNAVTVADVARRAVVALAGNPIAAHRFRLTLTTRMTRSTQTT